MRDRRRSGRAVMRAPAGAARHRDGAARGGHRGGRRERAQRRLPDRRRGRLPQRRARAVRGRAGARDVRAHARGAAGHLRARRGARRRRGAFGRWACCAWPCPRRRRSTCATTPPRCARTASRARRSSARTCRPPCSAAGSWRCLTDHDGALHPARWYRLLAAAAEAAGARICEGTRGARARARARTRGRWSRSEAACAPGTWSWPPTARCRRSCPSTRAACARAGCTWSPPSRCRRRSTRLVYARWGYEYLQQRPDGRILAGGFSDVDADDSYTDSDAGSPADLGARRALPARGPRRATGASPTAGRASSATATTRCPTWARCPAATGLYVSGGYSGVGNVPGFMCGRDLADTIAGNGPEPLFPADREPWTPAAHDRRAERAARRERFAERTRASKAMFQRAERTLAGGVTSSFHRPRAVARVPRARRGRAGLGLDGNEYLDFHNGFSAMVQGHAHPAIVAAVRERAAARHALRRHHRGCGGGGRGARAPLRTPALALHELGHRVEHGGDPARARRHGPRGRGARWPAPTTGTPRSRTLHEVDFNDPEALERAHRRGRAGLRDHGGSDDERRARAPGAGLPRRRARR